MNLAFFTYFFKYIFASRTRQKLIFLAILGLLLSSFSLVVIQGMMGGLQKGLVDRSKNVLGHGTIQFSQLSTKSTTYKEVLSFLIDRNIPFTPELELELLVQNDKYVSPIILHGIDTQYFELPFLKGKDSEGIILASDLGRDIRAFFGSQLYITSPSHTDTLLEEIPRQVSAELSDFYTSEIPEIDAGHGWVRLSFLQNLIRKRSINKIRIFKDFSQFREEFETSFPEMNFISWEKENSSLVWALYLETKVMLFLFIGMSFLIGICITSGFLIFYNKIKIDLASFWILGMSVDKVSKLSYLFGQTITIVFSFLGVVLGGLFLYLLDSKKLIIMPEHFVERNIPVNITIEQVLISFLVPYLVSSVFTHFTFKSFKSGNFSFLSLIRKVG